MRGAAARHGREAVQGMVATAEAILQETASVADLPTQEKAASLQALQARYLQLSDCAVQALGDVEKTGEAAASGSSSGAGGLPESVDVLRQRRDQLRQEVTAKNVSMHHLSELLHCLERDLVIMHTAREGPAVPGSVSLCDQRAETHELA